MLPQPLQPLRKDLSMSFGNRRGATARGGLGFLEALCLVFVVLKLVGVISWPWLLVLSPVLLQLGVVLVCLAAFLIASAVRR